jgi:hypothetical protein
MCVGKWGEVYSLINRKDLCFVGLPSWYKIKMYYVRITSTNLLFIFR